MTTTEKKIIVARPHGFCSGVARAVETIDRVLDLGPAPVYCFNEIVHNQQVVGDLRRRGIVFVTRLADVPEHAMVLFSAHGVSPAIRCEAERKGLRVIDATCPFVSKVHTEVKRYARDGFTIILIGHRNHDEVVGVAGEAPDHVIVVETEAEARQLNLPESTPVAAVKQTTLSMDAAERIVGILRSRFPNLQTPAKQDICYATQNRQKAVRALADVADLVLVLGSVNSSNSRRLVEVASRAGCKAELVSDRSDLAALELSDIRTLGVTSGASTPDSYLEEILADLSGKGFGTVEELIVAEENVRDLALPPELKSLADNQTS